MNIIWQKFIINQYNNSTKNLTKISKISPRLNKLIIDKNLEFDSEYNIVKLTKNNAKIIEAEINNDEDYFPFSKILYNYYGAEKVKNNSEQALFCVIREIDRDNSTNVWRYKQNRDNFKGVIKYLVDTDNNFFEKLKSGQKELPDIIVEKYGTGLKSLSSKICKYLSEWMFGKDNYYINDKYIRHALLFYLDYYKVDKKVNNRELKCSRNVDNLSYKDLFDLLDKLNKSAKSGLTKNELDHILWYCYKSFKA